MTDAIGDTTMVIDESTGIQMTQKARERMEKKAKEQAEHKKRLAAMKAKKAAGAGVKAARPKFDRNKLSSGFMTNAKKAKDEVNGWALDFENPI